MEIINKMNNCSIELEGLKHLSEEQKSVCKTLREEIEKKRAELMRSPNALCTSLLGMFNQFERMSWDEILSNDFELINSVAEVENVSRIEVLNCILLLNPPKWKEFFWQQQYEKKTTEMLHLLFQFVPMKHDTCSGVLNLAT